MSSISSIKDIDRYYFNGMFTVCGAVFNVFECFVGRIHFVAHDGLLSYRDHDKYELCFMVHQLPRHQGGVSKFIGQFEGGKSIFEPILHYLKYSNLLKTGRGC